MINAAPNVLDDKNVTTLAIEIAKSCLLAAGSNSPVIGAWSRASVRQSQLVNANPPSGLWRRAVDCSACSARTMRQLTSDSALFRTLP